jgi:hypothetical protein
MQCRINFKNFLQKVGGAHTPFTVSQMSFFRSTISKKIVFFAFFYRILVKRSFNEEKVTLIILLLLFLITGFSREPGNMKLPSPCFIVIK